MARDKRNNQHNMDKKETWQEPELGKGAALGDRSRQRLAVGGGGVEQIDVYGLAVGGGGVEQIDSLGQE